MRKRTNHFVAAVSDPTTKDFVELKWFSFTFKSPIVALVSCSVDVGAAPLTPWKRFVTDGEPVVFFPGEMQSKPEAVCSHCGASKDDGRKAFYRSHIVRAAKAAIQTCGEHVFPEKDVGLTHFIVFRKILRRCSGQPG